MKDVVHQNSVSEPAPRPRLLIAGCSTRAAAWSAVRAGFAPVCIDQFGDRDLCEVAEVIPVTRYPADLPTAVRDAATVGWLPVGGLENSVEILRALSELNSRIGPCLGATPADIATLRDPVRLQTIARECGWREAAVWSAASRCQEVREHIQTVGSPLTCGNWLVKPLQSGGGLGIRRLKKPEDVQEFPNNPRVYYQQFMPGVPCAVLMLIGAGDIECLGWSQQLIGLEPEVTGEPFAYHGSIGPLPMSADLARRWELTTARLIAGTRYRGLLGIDVICHGNEVSLIEVNPRYTASCEILELQQRRPLLERHCRAFGLTVRTQELPEHPDESGGRMIGKRIVYADHDLTIAERSLAELTISELAGRTPGRSHWTLPEMSDLPWPGTRFSQGQPVCTVWACGTGVEDVASRLEERVQQIRTRLRISP